MPNGVRFHEMVEGQHLQDEHWWTLVQGPDGKRFVRYERHHVDPGTKRPEVTSRRLSVKTILAQGNELSAKLQSVLEASLSRK